MPPISPMLQQPTYRLVTGFSIGPDLPSLLATPATAPSFARDPRRDIRFFCDEMDLDADGRLSVVGWAVCAVGISAIVVHLDDEEMGEAELGLAPHGRGRRIPPHPDGALCGVSLCQVTWPCA